MCVVFDTLRGFVWLVIWGLDVSIVPTDVADKPVDCFMPLSSLALGQHENRLWKSFAECKPQERKFGQRVGPLRDLHSNYGLEILWP